MAWTLEKNRHVDLKRSYFGAITTKSHPHALSSMVMHAAVVPSISHMLGAVQKLLFFPTLNFTNDAV